MFKRKTLLALVLLLVAWPLQAQFYLNGDDPGRLRWNTIQTPHYQLIYPEGADSLARVYGRQLEQFRVPLGRSYGVTPGEGQHRKMPVILHAYYPYSNGSVGWAPQRMDLYPLPPANGADPLPWSVQLAAHEPRHQAQLQGWTFLNWLTGEAWNPVKWQFYQSWALGEGDAVVAETGLTASGRARTADFLGYYRYAFDQGDFRTWARWRYGSYKYYTPDHYALGYLSLAGARVMHEDPFLMKETVEASRKRPWLFSANNFRRVVKEHNGGKPSREAFRDIQEHFNALWQADAATRAPFLDLEQITPKDAFPMEYTTPQMGADGILYALRSGHAQPDELVAIKDGKVRHLKYLNGTNMSLFYEPVKNRLYFSELRRDVRWKLSGTSVVAYYDIGTRKTRDLAAGHYYYNAQPSKDGSLLATAEYLPGGQQYVVLLSAEDGSVVRRFRAPDGIQPCEFGWYGNEVYLSGVSIGGFGIYRIDEGGAWEEVLAPSIQKVTAVGYGDGYVEWVSDRTGVNELYRYFPADGRLLQITSTRHGITDPYENGEYLYTVSQTLVGMQLFRIPLSDLKPREVAYAQVHSYPIADAITEQEQALGPAPNLSSAVPVSAPKRYSKLLHPLRLHSWLPLYVNYDRVKAGSMDFTYKTASLGASGFFQNTLGTFSGMVGYGLHPSPDNHANWRNALHLKAVYSGLYPVFEASLDLGDRAARQYYVDYYQQGPIITNFTVGSFARKAPLVEASLKVYVPLSLRRYGVTYGLTPQLSYTFTNNYLAPDPVVWKVPKYLSHMRSHYRLSRPGSDEGNVLMQRLTASLRSYVMLSRAQNEEYPRLGIGAEMGVNLRLGLQQLFAPNVYAYLYGYLPGIVRPQGLRVSAMVQRQLRGDGLVFGELAASTLPRGFDSAVGSVVARANQTQWKLTGDYAIPIYLGDINLFGAAYIKNFVLTPHADYTGLSYGDLWSAGADVVANLAKLILPFDSSLGVSFSWLGGSWYKSSGQERPWSLGLVFDMSF